MGDLSFWQVFFMVWLKLLYIGILFRYKHCLPTKSNYRYIDNLKNRCMIQS